MNKRGEESLFTQTHTHTHTHTQVLFQLLSSFCPLVVKLIIHSSACLLANHLPKLILTKPPRISHLSRSNDSWFIVSSSFFLEKAMAPHSSTLAWKIPWTEEPGGLQSMGSLRVWRDWGTSLSLFTVTHWRRKWQPTPVFLPGESQGLGSLMGVAQSRTRLKRLSSSSSFFPLGFYSSLKLFNHLKYSFYRLFQIKSSRC